MRRNRPKSQIRGRTKGSGTRIYCCSSSCPLLCNDHFTAPWYHTSIDRGINRRRARRAELGCLRFWSAHSEETNKSKIWKARSSRHPLHQTLSTSTTHASLDRWLMLGCKEQITRWSAILVSVIASCPCPLPMAGGLKGIYFRTLHP